MNADELRHLDRVEGAHWFYRGKRRLVRAWLLRHARLGPGALVVDAGMGTGRFLAELDGPWRRLGLDAHPASLALAAPRVQGPRGAVVRGGLPRLPLADACADAVTLLDVIEHLDDDAAALDEALRVTRPGGLVVITVPALRWLWSAWDVALGHRRRYHRADLLALVTRPDVEVVHCAYTNWAALLPLAAVRLWQRLVPARPGARAEDRVPGLALNALLEWSLVAPARRAWVRPPLGAALLAVLRRVPAGPGPVHHHAAQRVTLGQEVGCRDR